MDGRPIMTGLTVIVVLVYVLWWVLNQANRVLDRRGEFWREQRAEQQTIRRKNNELVAEFHSLIAQPDTPTVRAAIESYNQDVLDLAARCLRARQVLADRGYVARQPTTDGQRR